MTNFRKIALPALPKRYHLPVTLSAQARRGLEHSVTSVTTYSYIYLKEKLSSGNGNTGNTIFKCMKLKEKVSEIALPHRPFLLVTLVTLFFNK